MIHILLILASMAVGLALIEVSLRIFYPKYQYDADSSFEKDTARIWTNKANFHYVRKHPDSGLPHTVYYNNIALRQHRNFSEQDIESAINLAFFGDSFTENLRIAVQYSLTEPLDYLLNKRAPGFNVLNLGVDGYGTDQEYLKYKDFVYSGNLNYVFYVFCENDLRNIYENNLFTLTEAQELVHNTRGATPWWINILSRLYTTYLILDVANRFQSDDRRMDLDITAIEQYYQKKNHEKRFHDKRAEAIDNAFVRGEKTADLDKSVGIFRSLLQLWSNDVKKNGGKFFVVLLPLTEEHKARDLIPDGISVIDLYELFSNGMENYNYSDWSFKNDGHWNEAGNQLAATYLYRFMENELNLGNIPEDKLKRELYTYYASFDGWMPDEKYLERSPVNAEEKHYIKSKYLSLEVNGEDR
jgi:hypothetical protein